jgi:uncharacterized protein (DUF1684 family)
MALYSKLMRVLPLFPALSLAVSLVAGDYAAQIAKFRSDLEKSLVREDGWATVVGLSWLKEGDNRAGSDRQADVLLPASLPAQVGIFSLHSGHVRFQPSAGVKLTAKDLKPNSDIIALGTVKFFLIQRGEGPGARFGVRVKDSDAATRKEFTHLSWYPVDPSWRIVAKYTQWDKPHVISFDTVITGLQEQDSSPGTVMFMRDNKEYTLEPAADGSIVFRDQTTGKATYGAGRFLDINLPKNLKTGASLVLDFNEAYNPPCVFTAYATCPLPPPQNRLTLAVTAGELMYNGHH